MSKCQQSAMGDNLDEFRSRGTSLFRSLRPKKSKSTKKTKSGGSSSIFSSLLLANYEQQMQFDPNASFSNELSYEKSREVIRDMKAKKPENVSQHEEDEEEEVKNNVVVTEVLDEAIVHELYANILFAIQHYLKSDYDQDLPAVNEQSAIDYVRDAFGIPETKHNELSESVKLKTESDFISSISEKSEAHTSLITILLKHELEISQTPRFYWSGKFSFLASSMLLLHSECMKLNEVEILLTKWSAFVAVHQDHPLDLKVFVDILKSMVGDIGGTRIMNSIENDKTNGFIPSCFRFPSALDESEEDAEANHLTTQDDEVLNRFWKSVGTLNKWFLQFIANLTEENDLEYLKVMILQKVCTIIRTLKRIERSRMNLNIEESIRSSIAEGTSRQILKCLNKNLLKSTDKCEQLNEIIRVLDITTANYKQSSERFRSIFKEYLDLDYSEILYKSMDSKLSTIVKTIANNISQSKDGNIDNFRESGDEFKITRKFFELFLKFKAFADIELELNVIGNLQSTEYFKWFNGGIDKWSDISIFSAFNRIQRIALLDNLKPLDCKTNHSQSAVDFPPILNSIRQFWEDSSSSVMDENVEYLALADLCRFSNIYFDIISDRVEKCHAMKHFGIFKVPLEICVGVSNITFVIKEMQNLSNELMQKNVEDYSRLLKLSENILEKAKNRKLKIMEAAVQKMESTMRKLLCEGADVIKKGTLLGERLIVYIEDSMLSLQEDLEPSDFKDSKNIILNALMKVYSELITKSLQIQRLPTFFTNLRTILHSLKELFLDEQGTLTNEKLHEIDSLLERHELNASKLIHQYYKDRYQLQEAISKSPFNPCGVLSVNCFFINNVLKLKILNAKNLIPLGVVNRKCDSFVKINIIPESSFPECQSNKTRVEMDTHFPLYDELFEFELTRDQRNMKDAIIFFNIKDKLLFTRNQTIAEAFLSFNDIPEYSKEQKFMKQTHLSLTRLQSDDMEPLKALQERSQAGDKTAKDFLAKIKFKLPDSPPKSTVINL